MQDSYSFFNVLQQYFAECALLPVFAIALIWIAIKWKTEYRRIIIAILCGSVLVFNEFVYRIFVAVGEGITYYRLLWTMPIVFVVAVFAVENITKIKASRRVTVVSILLLAVFMFSGQSGAEWFSLPENIYQIDEDAIQVADTLMEITGGESTYLLDNGELDMSIRQYEPRVVYTNNLESGLWEVINGMSPNVLGSDIMRATYEDRSAYLALRKDEPLAHKLVESAGYRFVVDTDNYGIYHIDYYTVHWDLVKIAELTNGNINRINIENILLSDASERYGYVYITDFGSLENEEIYRELVDKISSLQPRGIIINDQLSANSEWYLEYEELLAEMQIPYYCNKQEFQIIEENDVLICMLDNRDGISDDVLEKVKALELKDKPVVLVLSSKIEDKADKLYSLLKEQEFVVQILSAKRGDYTKDLIGENLLQYAVPVDEKQILSMIYFNGPENNK